MRGENVALTKNVPLSNAHPHCNCPPFVSFVYFVVNAPQTFFVGFASPATICFLK